jgi:hypothetical protein
MKLDMKAQLAHGGPAHIAAVLADLGVSLPAAALEDFASPAGIALVVRKRDGSSIALMRSGHTHWNVALPADVSAILYTKGAARIIRKRE